MSELRIQIPESMGLSAEQIKRLEEVFRNQLADMVRGTKAEATALAKPQIMFQNEISKATVPKAIDV